MPLGLLHQHRLDALWNEEFKYARRAAILGRTRDRDPSFEWTVRELVDCRNLGFADQHDLVISSQRKSIP